MAQYIDKDALVAEIEKRKNICKKVVWDLRTKENQDYYQGKAEAYKEVLDLLDTLEVKEVDLEKEILNHIGDEGSCKHGKWTWYECNKMIRYFFELGIKATQKDADLENNDAVNATIDFPLIGADFPNIYPNYKELKDYCIRHCIKDNDKVKITIVKEK